MMLDAKPQASPPVLLDVSGLSVRFRTEDGDVTAVKDVSFQLALGETLCLLGESGSGKTVTMRALMRLLPPTARLDGRILLAEDLTAVEA